jgi:hypothetical protein
VDGELLQDVRLLGIKVESHLAQPLKVPIVVHPGLDEGAQRRALVHILDDETFYLLPAERRLLLEPGLEKTRFKKKQPTGFFLGLFGFFGVFLGFLGFFGFFLVFSFFLFFLYICPEERVLRVFSVSRILLGASRL